MFWASWLLGPAAGPKGVSMRSPKMGRLLPVAWYCLCTPNTSPQPAYSVITQLIADVVAKVCFLREDEAATLSYIPARLTKKFSTNEFLLKNRVSMNVTSYYPYIRDRFKELEGINGFRLDALSLQIKSCFIKMEGLSDNKSDIFDQLVN